MRPVTARFELHAGSHPEEGHLTVSVAENPVNPWMLASSATRTMIFHPAGATQAQPYRVIASDAGAPQAGRNLASAGVLRTLQLSTMDMTRARLFVGGTAEVRKEHDPRPGQVHR